MSDLVKKLTSIFGLIAGALVVITTLSGGAVWALETRFDARYLLVAESLEGKLLDLEDEIFEMEQQEKWEGLTQREKEKLDRLIKRAKQLSKKLGG